MKLVQTQIIKNNHKDYVELDRLCFLSKNLYNATLYCVRQQFFKEKTYLNYATINAEFTHTNQADYRALPAKVSKQTQKLVEQDFLSFFAAFAVFFFFGAKVFKKFSHLYSDFF